MRVDLTPEQVAKAIVVLDKAQDEDWDETLESTIDALGAAARLYHNLHMGAGCTPSKSS